MRFYLLVFTFCVTVWSGCSTSKIFVVEQHSFVEKITAPTHVLSYNYFLLGSVGSHEVRIDDVCTGRKMSQMISEYTLGDNLWAWITLGLYTPRTLKVWCD